MGKLKTLLAELHNCIWDLRGFILNSVCRISGIGATNIFNLKAFVHKIAKPPNRPVNFVKSLQKTTCIS